jgi:hypothetical protein
LLARGPSQPAELARALRQHRHKVTAALKQLERERRAHSTGATIACRWHLGPAPAAPASGAPRRAL